MCRGCGAPIPLTSRGDRSCKCSVTTPVTNHGGDGEIVSVIRVDAKGRAADPPPVEPVAMHCPNCPAGLRITSDRQRLADCEHCGSQIHLPDAIWRKLHPPHVVERWWAIIASPSKTERAREASRKRQVKDREREKKKAEERAQKEKERREGAEAKKEQEALERSACNRRTLLGLAGAPILALGAWATMAGVLVMLTVALTQSASSTSRPTAPWPWHSSEDSLASLHCGQAVLR